MIPHQYILQKVILRTKAPNHDPQATRTHILYIHHYVLLFMGMPCGVGTAKCEVKELSFFFQNWMSMLKGLKENVLKIMIIFQN